MTSGRRWRRVALWAGGLVMASAAGGGILVQLRLRQSLPLTSGVHALSGLSAEVRVERDALGVLLLRGRSRADLARTLGFVHAQERFFQMDLLRRRAAGELAEVFGPAALPLDRQARRLRLRTVAGRALAVLPRNERALIDAYAEGVNAGLRALRAPSFEYLLLRTEPAAWRSEDSLLCGLAMAQTLQGDLPGQESTLGLMHDLLPPSLFEFLAPRGTEWDAPLRGEAFPQPPIPGPEALDLRGSRPPAPAPSTSGSAALHAPGAAWGDSLLAAWFSPADPQLALGSNNWAFGGGRTADGSALVANDMHLGLSVPNTWYRASLVYDTAGGTRQVTGVTLPGLPYLVAGSNGRVAWAFTNSEGDWADLVVLEADPDRADAYRTAQGPRRYERVAETIRVAGGGSERLEILETIWGPVADQDHRGRRRALAWTALREGGIDAALARLEAADSVAEALALAPECGMPQQNLVVGDALGHVGWTIIGRIPNRFGHDGRLPVSWADGRRGWDGWLPAEQQPRITDPPSGRIWSANARMVDGADLAQIGFGGYALGARQRQIRDDLMAIERATEADMLRVQLDDRAVFLSRWQALALRTLTPPALEGQPLRAEARRFVEGWGARAAVDSVGYRIVRGFRQQAAALALRPLLAPCQAASQEFDLTGRLGPRQWEGPLWALVTERPPHLLDPRHPSWDALLLRALDETLAELTRDGARLAERTWGERNTTRIQHPITRAVPALAPLLDMPALRLPGDGDLPRVQSPAAGASQRFAVTPGREERGTFHMPVGQSGHPLSPHYADGHQAWARGEATPFLPGPPVATMRLVPPW